MTEEQSMAYLHIRLKADSGYECKLDARINAEQWSLINAVVAGKLADELPPLEAVRAFSGGYAAGLKAAQQEIEDLKEQLRVALNGEKAR